MFSRTTLAAGVLSLLRLVNGAEAELVPGVRIERELAKGVIHSFPLKMAASQFLRAAAEARGIDIQLAVFAPDGTKAAAIDNQTALAGRETVAVVAATGGTYRLEISASEPTGGQRPLRCIYRGVTRE